MKNILIILLIASYSFTGFAKGEGVGNGPRGKGEGVGNGKREGVGNFISKPLFGHTNYQSDSFIRFDSRLSVVESAERTSIANTKLVSTGQPVSTITFELMRKTHPDTASIKTTQQLISYLGTKRPWKDVKIAGAEGYFIETKSSGRLQSEYYLITASGDLIRVVIDAHEVGDGLKLVAPIVRTMSVDEQAPVVRELKIEGGLSHTAGQRVRMLARITDDLSGFHSISDGSDAVTFTRADGGATNWFRARRIQKKIGPDLYAFEFEIPLDTAPGEYIFNGLVAFDNAQNLNLFVYLPGKSKEFYMHSNLEDSQPDRSLRLLRLKVDNSNPVEPFAPPKLAGLKGETQVNKPGEGAEFLVYLPNKKSNEIDISWEAEFYNMNQNYYPNQYNYKGVLEPSGRNDGWYSAKFTSNHKSAPGIYFLERIYLYEKNQPANIFFANEQSTVYHDSETKLDTTVPVVKMTILPIDRSDVIPPALRELKVEGNLGAKGSLLARVTDIGLGVDESTAMVGTFSQVNQFPGKSFIAFSGARTSKDSKDWYRLTPYNPEYLPEGQYVLGTLEFRDKAGNKVSLRTGLGPNYHDEDGKDTGVPMLIVNFSR